MHLKKKKNVQLLKSKRQSKAITVTLLLLRENKRCMRNEVGTFFSFFYGSREGTIQNYFANPKKYFKSQYFSQITVEKFDRSKKLLQILRKFVDPQITFSIIRK